MLPLVRIMKFYHVFLNPFQLSSLPALEERFVCLNVYLLRIGIFLELYTQEMRMRADNNCRASTVTPDTEVTVINHT